MSNITVDLKVIEVTAPMVARALNEPVALTIGGLNLLWHRCWSLKTDTITAVGLAGIFGPENIDARIAQLVDAGFLSPSAQGFRVKGAERYLRIKNGNSKGGHASKSNLVPGGKSRRGAEGGAEGGAETRPEREPRGSREPPSGLFGSSPNTEHRTPNTESKSTAPLFASPPRDSDLLVQDFKAVTGSDYLWQGAKDGTALAALLKAATLDEVRTRWRRGLAAPATAWASCRTVAQLRSKWNDLGGESSSRGIAPVGVFLETRDVTL